MRKILAAGVGLAGMLCGAAHADIIYQWRAQCVDRWTWESHDRIELPCPTQVGGLVKFWDGFQAGVDYRYNDSELPDFPYPKFTLYETLDHLRLSDAELDVYDFGFAGFNMPEYKGPGTLYWVLNGLRLAEDGFFPESPFPNGSGIRWENMIFTRVPEPATALLFGAGLLGMIGISRRRGASR